MISEAESTPFTGWEGGNLGLQHPDGHRQPVPWGCLWAGDAAESPEVSVTREGSAVVGWEEFSKWLEL